MSDEADQAQDFEQRERDASIHRALSKRHSPVEAVEFCTACEERIPAARLKAVAGTQHCAFCQSQLENQK